MAINSIFSSAALTNLVSNPKAQNLVSVLADETKPLQVGLLETSVLAGRSYQAQKRGGYYEFKETLLEGVLAAAVWMGGIKVLNKLADKFCKNVLNINTTIDWKQIPKMAEGRINPNSFIKKTVTAKSVKLLFSIATSLFTVGILLPKYKQKLTRDGIERDKKLKVEQRAKLEKLIQASGNGLPHNFNYSDLKILADPTFKGVKSNDNNVENNKTQGQVSFTGGAFGIISKLGHALENETIPQLLVVDTGITSGRLINARNKDEGIEILFRDSASALFYYACVPVLTGVLAKTFDAKLGINTTVDPKILDEVVKKFNQTIVEASKKGPIDIKDVQKMLLGVNNDAVVKVIHEAVGIKAKISPQEIAKVLNANLTEISKSATSQVAKELQGHLQDISMRAAKVAKSQANSSASKQLLKLGNLMDDIAKSPVGKDSVIQQLAQESNKLSAELYATVRSGASVDKKLVEDLNKLFTNLKKSNLDEKTLRYIDRLSTVVNGRLNSAGYISKEALEEVVQGGIARDSEFAQTLLAKLNPNIKNPTKYVAEGQLKSIQSAFTKFSERTLAQLEKEGVLQAGKKVDIKDVEKALNKTLSTTKNKTLVAKALYLTAGIAVGVVFLSTIIPKAQYLITKIRTGKEGFPGVAGLVDEGNEKKVNPNIIVNPNKDKFLTTSNSFNVFLDQYTANQAK